MGHVIDQAGHAQAVWWKGGGIEILPKLSAPFSKASRINDAGQIVGRVGIEGGAVHAALWNNGPLIDLGTLSGSGDSFAADINEQGVVAGSSAAAVGTSAFTWTIDQGFVDYGNTAPPFRLAVAGFNGLNNNGLLVGTSFILLSPYTAAFAHEGDKGLTDLGPPGRNLGMALAVNDAGTIVGYQSGADNVVQATIFHGDGSFDHLGSLGLDESWALDVNDHDVIVGRAFSFDAGGLIPKAFVHDGQQMHDILELAINPEGWTLIEATAINSGGVIVGNGLLDGKSRAFMATPVAEPASWGLGLVGVSLYAWTFSKRPARRCGGVRQV